jgi:4-diphosphocytidyl-2-C-methyl-D-erythritol kinase
MVCFPNAKINLGLHIVGKRPDGFHNLHTVFYPIQIKDILEVIPVQNEQQQIQFSQSGIPVDGNEANNLCVKAYQLIKKLKPAVPAIQMHLHKNIPMGAGLGGGSADGAFALKQLNQQFDLNIPQSELLEMALQLGSDCPFFIYNQPCLATGRGEILTPISLDLSAYSIFIVNPGIHVNTGWAFSQITYKSPAISLSEAINLPIAEWKKNIENDFETAVFKTYPAIEQIKNKLYEAGAIYASMSGSGSTVFGIFNAQKQLSDFFPTSYFCKWV